MAMANPRAVREDAGTRGSRTHGFLCKHRRTMWRAGKHGAGEARVARRDVPKWKVRPRASLARSTVAVEALREGVENRCVVASADLP